MKRDVPIAPTQLRALVLLLLCLPLVPTALLVRLIGQADKLMDNEASAAVMPVYHAQLGRAAALASAEATPRAALRAARRLLGSSSKLSIHDHDGLLLAGDREVLAGEELLEQQVLRPGGNWTLALALDPISRGSGLNSYLALAAVVTGGVFVAALAAGLTLNRQLKIQEIKSDALNAVSHELKTPLSSMRVLLETLEDGRVTDEQTRGEYVALLMAENQRMGRVLSDFLSLARLERNRRTFRMAPTIAADAVRGAVGEALPKVEKRGGRIRCYGPADGPLVIGEGTALEGVLAILLDNAVKYSKGAPDLEVVYFESGRYAYFIVKDRGIGVRREFRRRIFDSFYQVDPTLSRRGGGCGLGLSIAWHVLAAHGGEIRHLPRRGRGSIFRFTVPLAPASRADAGSDARLSSTSSPVAA